MTYRCKLCLEEKQESEMRASHAIPNSFFREALRGGGGKAVYIVGDDETPLKYSQDSYTDLMLCDQCEHLINDNYEAYSIGVLRGNSGRVNKIRSEKKIYFSGVDTRKLYMFCASILWRSAINRKDFYRRIYVTESIAENFRQAILLNDDRWITGYMSVVITRFVDKTKILSDKDVRTIVMSPTVTAKRHGKIMMKFKFIFYGFVFELFFPKLKNYERAKIRGFVDKGTDVLVVPIIDLTDDEDLFKIISSGLKKESMGLSMIK